MAAKKPSIGVKDFNDLISCFLCKGYLIDATTVIECLHSFCKTCIINHLDSNTPKSRFCPRCDNQIHKTKPKLNIRSDPTLQDIVYKLVPGLYKNEMNRRKEFYSKEQESAVGLSNEEKGEVSGERLIFTPEDSIYLAIEYFPQIVSYSLLPFSKNLTNGSLNVEPATATNGQRRFLECKGGMRVLHLKKWLKLKYDVRDHNDIEILYKHDPLLDDYTMMDLAYIYSWRRNGPLCLYYKIVDDQKHSRDDGRPFKAPEALKRRHTLKHRHKQKASKRLRLIDESNLITTNPVNEPLPPVDSALINRVMASNSIGTNIDIMTSVVNSALNINKTKKVKQKQKKFTKNESESDDIIKQMKKNLVKSLKTNKKSVTKTIGDYGNCSKVDLMSHNLISNGSATNILSKVADKSEPTKVVEMLEPSKLANNMEPINMANKSEPIKRTKKSTELTKLAKRLDPIKVANRSELKKGLNSTEQISVANHLEPTPVTNRSEPIRMANKSELNKVVNHSVPIRVANTLEPSKMVPIEHRINGSNEAQNKSTKCLNKTTKCALKIAKTKPKSLPNSEQPIMCSMVPLDLTLKNPVQSPLPKSMSMSTNVKPKPKVNGHPSPLSPRPLSGHNTAFNESTLDFILNEIKCNKTADDSQEFRTNDKPQHFSPPFTPTPILK